MYNMYISNNGLAYPNWPVLSSLIYLSHSAI